MTTQLIDSQYAGQMPIANFGAELRLPHAEMECLALATTTGQLALVPGLPVEAAIPLRKRTALQYLLEPLGQTVWRSFREN